MTVSVINDNFMICADCVSIALIGDATSFDYYYSEEEAEARLSEVERGIKKAGGSICAGDSDKDLEFSISPCHCCGSNLAGSRVHCVILSR